MAFKFILRDQRTGCTVAAFTDEIPFSGDLDTSNGVLSAWRGIERKYRAWLRKSEMDTYLLCVSDLAGDHDLGCRSLQQIKQIRKKV